MSGTRLDGVKKLNFEFQNLTIKISESDEDGENSDCIIASAPAAAL
jgi:hypothetical protein